MWVCCLLVKDDVASACQLSWWCIGGVPVVIWWCLGGVSVMYWCKPRGVSVSIAQVRNVVFARYFAGVAVAFERYFWWCIGGLLLVGVLVVLAWHVRSHMGRYFNGVLHLRAQTQYTISNNLAHLWPMTSPALFLSLAAEPT